MLECEACDGLWVDADVFERICGDRESQTIVLHRFAPGSGAARAARVQYRPCPRCHKMMNRVNFGRLSGAIVDVCKGHGTFLDAGELHLIVTFIVQGGLERARTRQIEELRDEQRKLDDAQRRASKTRDASAAFDSPVAITSRSAGTVVDLPSLGDLFDLIKGN